MKQKATNKQTSKTNSYTQITVWGLPEGKEGGGRMKKVKGVTYKVMEGD